MKYCHLQQHRHRDYHTKWSKSDRERQLSYHFYVESKKNDTNKQNRKRLTDIENKFMTTKEDSGAGEINLRVWD